MDSFGITWAFSAKKLFTNNKINKHGSLTKLCTKQNHFPIEGNFYE